MSPLILALLAPLAQGHALEDAFRDAAREHEVPRPLLEAIAWEATRFNQEARTIWHGYGMMDLVEGDRQPSLEQAAILLEVSPDLLIRDFRWNIRGAAALLAWQARLSNGGVLPDDDDLLAWWDAVRAFSRSDDPTLQGLYATTIYDVLNTGTETATPWGTMRLEPVAVSHWDRCPVPVPSPSTDYAGAAQFVSACSSNYSDYNRPSDGNAITYVIIHTIQGSYSGCISWFQNCSSSVSAHYVVRSSDGQVTQMVREADVGWHAGNWTYNLHSVGIEHEGYVEDPGTWYTEAMYAGSAALTADICARNGIPVDRSHILAHYEVPGATHTDPGSGWDWDHYMSLISGGAGTGSLLGVVADQDIYNGARIVGASVWIEQTGDRTTTSSSGMYEFNGLPFGTYTVHATADGYQEGTCTKEITGSGDFWCSIALQPGGDTDPPDDTGPAPDTDPPVTDDTAPPDTAGEPPVGPPGGRELLSDHGGCACSAAPAPRAAILPGLLLLLGLRRRRP